MEKAGKWKEFHDCMNYILRKEWDVRLRPIAKKYSEDICYCCGKLIALFPVEMEDNGFTFLCPICFQAYQEHIITGKAERMRREKIK